MDYNGWVLHVITSVLIREEQSGLIEEVPEQQK